MDYTSDVEMVLEEHPDKVNELIQSMNAGTEEEAYRVLNKEVKDFHHALTQVIQNSRELTDFQKTLADSILGYVHDNEYNEQEMQRLANQALKGNYPNGLVN